MKRITFFIGWVIFSLLTITANVLVVMSFLNTSGQPILLAAQPSVHIATSVDSFSPPTNDVLGLQTTIQEEDARIPIVTNFLQRHESPLQPYDEWGKKLVVIADKYGIDFRLLPAIAMQESNLCKVIPPNTYNCLGFGIHSRGTLAFNSYEENFDRAARELKQNYIDGGRVTPELIMKKYTPHSNGSWADSVNQWIAEMKYDDRQKGRDSTASADITEYAKASPTPAGIAK